jgi:hypothetical protein
MCVRNWRRKQQGREQERAILEEFKINQARKRRRRRFTTNCNASSRRRTQKEDEDEEEEKDGCTMV